MAQSSERYVGDHEFLWRHEVTPAGNRVALCGKCPWLALFPSYEEANYRAALHALSHGSISGNRARDRVAGQRRIEALLA